VENWVKLCFSALLVLSPIRRINQIGEERGAWTKQDAAIEVVITMVLIVWLFWK
jgi:hypothetical protein